MTERVEQQICIKFCIKLEHSSMETIRMIQKATAMGNWWLQLHHDNMPTHASRLMQSFLAKHQITQVTQPPYNPGLAPCDFCLFPKWKSSLKGKRFQTINDIQENTMGQLGELCEVTRCLLWRELRHHCPMYYVSYIFFNKCLHFSYYMAGYLLNRLHIDRDIGIDVLGPPKTRIILWRVDSL